MLTDAVKRNISSPEPSSISKPVALDRISELPEHIIHGILSGLPTIDAARTSVLSKKFRLAWNSFPIIDFDDLYDDSFREDILGREQFLDFMHESLQRRPPNLSLKKFRLRVELENIKPDNRIDRAISYALEHRVQELDLDVSKRGNDYGVFYNFPSVLFDDNSVLVLKLQGFNLETLDLTKFPRAEKLSFVRCNWLKTLKVNSTAPLKSVELDGCRGVSLIDIDNSNLQSFTFKGRKTDGEFDAFEIKLAKSLKNLVLKRATITCRWLDDHVSKFLLLENLKLSRCHKLKDIHIRSPSLKVLEIRCCNGLKGMEIAAPNLLTFVYNGDFKECDIIITACKSLRSLELYHANVTDVWVKKIVSENPFLVNLKLFQCEMLEKLKISHRELRSFQLLECSQLMEVEIFAPKLKSFRYHGEVIQSPLWIDSPGLEVELALIFYSLNITNQWYWELGNFLGYFDHCKVLTFVCSFEETLIFPQELRENLLPPLFDIKHLKVQMNSPPRDIVRFVDSLLWISPLLETLSIIVSGSGESSLKFQYANPANFEEEDLFCCRSRIIKCWRHYMKTISLENFQNDNDKDRLIKFFVRKTMRLESIKAT